MVAIKNGLMDANSVVLSYCLQSISQLNYALFNCHTKCVNCIKYLSSVNGFLILNIYFTNLLTSSVN